MHRESRKQATRFCKVVARAVRLVEKEFVRITDLGTWPNKDHLLVQLPAAELDRQGFADRVGEKGLPGQWTAEGFVLCPPANWGNTEYRRIGCDLLAIYLEVGGFTAKVVKNDLAESPVRSVK